MTYTHKKLTAQIATGKMPDIFTVGSDLVDILHRSGKAMDLAPHVSSDSHWNNVLSQKELFRAI